MKFFRQTKETKRKISFFMALAMVISLLPVSPVAKAAEAADAKIEVYSNVKNAQVKTVAKGTATGTAVITLESSVTGKVISSASIEAKLPGNGVTTSGAVKEATVTVASPAGVQGAFRTTCTVEDGICTVNVSDIVTSTAIVLTGSVELKDKTNTPPVEPAKKHSVKFKDNGFNYSDITLSISSSSNTKVSSSAAISVEDGTEIKFTIEPKDSKAKFNEIPKLTADNNEIDWTGTASRTATITIKADTEISITGGKVVKVAVTDTVKPSEVDSDLGLGEVTIDKNELIDDVVTNIVADNITIPNVDTITDEIVKEILSALEDKNNTKVETTLKVSSATESAITEANATINKATSFTGDTSNLGNSADVIKTKVKEMMARKDSVALDITLNSIITIGSAANATTASIAVKTLGDEIEVTMNKPENLNKDNAKGDYYVIRIHDDEVSVIKCDYNANNNKISFKSNKFSTYIISFVPSTNDDNTGDDDNTNPKPNPPSGGGSIGGYVPSTSATPAPSATAAPSASPSADPSATPGVDSSAAPSESGAPSIGGDTTPTKAPEATNKPVDSDKDDNNGGTTSTAVKVGKKATVSGSQYKVTAVKGTRTVQFTKGKKNAKSIVVPSTVKISGKNYKVTTIAKNAFKGNKKLTKVTIGKNVNKIGASAFQNCSKLKSIVIKSTKLTAKKVGKNAFKGINKKATVKVPKSKVKAYKKIVKAKGAGKNVKVKK